MMCTLIHLLLLLSRQDGAMTLEQTGATDARMGYYPIKVALSQTRPQSILKEPSYRSTPKYGVIQVGNGPKGTCVVALDEPPGQDWKIFIDRNHNGDLSDDGDGDWNEKSTPGNRVRYGVMHVTLRASYGTATEEFTSSEYTLGIYRFTDIPSLLMYRESARKGSVTIGGTSYLALLMENDADAVFSKRFASAEEAGETHPIWLCLDTVKDGKYATKVDIRAPFEFQGQTYEATANPDGSRLAVLSTTKSLVVLDLNERATLKARSGDFAGAIVDRTLLIGRTPGLASAWYQRGEVRLQKGDLDDAIADYSRAIELDPTAWGFYNGRGRARDQKKDFDGAIADYNRVLELNPKEATAYNNRGVSRCHKNDVDGAVVDYTRSIEINPKDPLPYSNRAGIRKSRKDYDGAIADLTRAAEL